MKKVNDLRKKRFYNTKAQKNLHRLLRKPLANWSCTLTGCNRDEGSPTSNESLFRRNTYD
jgi:hypothetical protein